MHFGVISDDSQHAREAYAALKAQYQISDLKAQPDADVEVIVVLGGDGLMLHSLHQVMHRNLPFYGMNCGTVGFLMNEFQVDGLEDRISAARPTYMYPLFMQATTTSGEVREALAINEVSLLRESHQTAKIRIEIDGVIALDELVADGILLATAAGSSAYNYSVGGPIVPIRSNILPLTPISPFRPRRWQGALLPHKAEVTFTVMDPSKRPVSATADFHEVRDVEQVKVREQSELQLDLLFDPHHALDERIIKEQFVH